MRRSPGSATSRLQTLQIGRSGPAGELKRIERRLGTLKRRQTLGRAWPGLHQRNAIRCPAAVSNFLMSFDKPPVVLLHGIAMSGNAWQDVVPLLSNYHEVFTPTALGHRGGPPVQRRPATITDVVDVVERYLDERGLDADPILPATPWADLWPSSWPGVVVRQPCARFLPGAFGRPGTVSKPWARFNGEYRLVVARVPSSRSCTSRHWCVRSCSATSRGTEIDFSQPGPLR